MIFTEFRFLAFFAIVFSLHWLLRGASLRKAWLLLSSYAFYAAWDWRFLGLIWLLRREFIFDPDRTGSALLAEGLDALEAHGAISRTEEGARVCDPSLMGEIFGLVRPLLESYALILRSGDRLVTGSDAKTLIRDLQRDEASLLASGTITRPEALSLVNLKNAIDTFAEDDVLKTVNGSLVDNPEARAKRFQALREMVI